MIIDDDRDVAQLTAKRLQSQGYATHCFFNGTEALTHVKAIAPDLILLDIWLPDISGIALYQKLRADGGATKIPIVFFSADPSQETLCLQDLAADAFITKPYKAARLLSIVQKLISQKEV